jgi:peroxiredoxin Q/BCP
MAQLRHDFDQFVKRDVTILVVGPESPKKFSSYFSDHDLPFIGLPDPKHSVLKRYGQEIKLFKLGRMPAEVLIDKEGIARYVHYGLSMSDIPTTEEILGLVDGLAKDARLGIRNHSKIERRKRNG